MTRARWGRHWVAALLAGVIALAGCANEAESKATTTTTAGQDPTTTTTEDRVCDQEPTVAPVPAKPVDGTPSDLDITSFDGTVIRAHWFPADGPGPYPTMLMGPGWSQPGATEARNLILFGALSITGMNDAGYNVLTWDPRGFGKSTGLASVNDPTLEGRDVQVLLDWVAEQAVASTDRTGDPRVGMVGVSYGGGIQLVLAALDCRVDVLVPSLAWHSLSTSLNRAETAKVGWAGVLNTAATTFGGRLDPHISSAATSSMGVGVLSEEEREWFKSRGPGDLIDDVSIPTLFVQGTVDTLFTLDEGIENYASLRKRDVPTAMIWFCGGHGTCLTDQGDTDWVNERTFAWLRRYLDGDESTDTGARFETVDQTGARWVGDDYPAEQGDPITASGAGTLQLDASSKAGPVTAPRPGSTDILSGIVLGITPAKAVTAIEVKVDPGDTDGLVLGAPELRFTYSGTTPAGSRPTRVFAQLVDDDTGIVVGNQITPIEIDLDGAAHEAAVDLESVAFHARPGHTLTLQIVATTPAYAEPRLGGSIDMSAIELTLPVATGLKPA